MKLLIPVKLRTFLTYTWLCGIGWLSELPGMILTIMISKSDLKWISVAFGGIAMFFQLVMVLLSCCFLRKRAARLKEEKAVKDAKPCTGIPMTVLQGPRKPKKP